MIWIAVFAAICWFYAVPPPLISGLAIWPFLLIARAAHPLIETIR